MATRHVAVIGAGFGDEGKGQIVDYLAAQGNHDTVVRFSGGSQAGHTVMCADGSFTFAQVGAGTLAGLPTHISRFMLVNPLYLLREVHALEALGIRPAISMDPRTRFIVPADVEANQQTEIARGSRRHGSVGHGVAHAVRRSVYTDLRLTAKDAKHSSQQAVLWVCEQARFFYPEYKLHDALVADSAYASATKEVLEKIVLRDDERVMRGPCIFEGSQGLLLDQNSGFFPYVTPANTGMTNICLLLSKSSIPVEPLYVTRTFLTRHGPGPMYLGWVHVLGGHVEGAESVFTGHASLPSDGTNPPNEWQGTLRYARLSIAQLDYVISRDYEAASTADLCAVLPPRLAVTWASSGALAADEESQEAYDSLRNLGTIPIAVTASGPCRESINRHIWRCGL